MLISDVDDSYDYIKVYYTRSTSDVDGNEITTAFRISKKYPVKNRTCNLIITGNEAGQDIPLSEINMQYLGAVPQDNNIKKAIMKQKPVSMIFPNATSSRHFEEIATRLMSEGADVPVHKRGIRGYLRSVFAKNM